MKSRKGREPNIDSKIRYIQKIAEEKKTLQNKYFSDTLQNDILQWKEDRNRLIHALLKQQLEHGEVGELAAKGKQLADALRTRAGSYNRSTDRQKAKETL